jgi:membrane protein implicated in regulation of membrane protease activity
MSILWWHWLVLGLLLILIELAVSGGFFIIFFGLSALIIGLAAGTGTIEPLWLQLLFFSVISVGSLMVFRNRARRWLQLEPQTPAIDTLVGEIGTATDPLAPGDIGRVELSAWSARNVSAVPLARGTRCRVVRVEGLMLEVGPEGGR